MSSLTIENFYNQNEEEQRSYIRFLRNSEQFKNVFDRIRWTSKQRYNARRILKINEEYYNRRGMGSDYDSDDSTFDGDPYAGVERYTYDPSDGEWEEEILAEFESDSDENENNDHGHEEPQEPGGPEGENVTDNDPIYSESEDHVPTGDTDSDAEFDDEQSVAAMSDYDYEYDFDYDFDNFDETFMSPRCPLSNEIMKIPVKSSFCRHYQCFDLINYLTVSFLFEQWRCPVCNITALPSSLLINIKFEEFLNKQSGTQTGQIMDN
ncbi:hypothetical protein RB653_005672 [Dictyostelium firmibasis]|uniref:SP-RING-type domain-containing protein n=1 Tax=Dictyostelium firmibasis TaxID=79012 RepID=A0AAN7UAM2_9MYCE